MFGGGRLPLSDGTASAARQGARRPPGDEEGKGQSEQETAYGPHRSPPIMWATGTAAHGFDLYGVGCVPAGAVAGPVVAGTAAGAVAGRVVAGTAAAPWPGRRGYRANRWHRGRTALYPAG